MADNFFSQFDPASSDAAPASPPPAPSDQPAKDPNFFAQFDPAQQPENQTGGMSSLFHAVQRGVLPMAGGLAASGMGAEVGSAVGGAIGAGIGGLVTLPLGGLGAVPGAEVGAGFGGFLGGLGGFWAGQTATNAAQDVGIHALPEGWQDALGQSDRQQKLDQEYHPTESYLGGLLPYAITMHPNFNAAAALPANATAWQRILANPMTARLFGGAAMGGMEAGQEKLRGEAPNWSDIAISTGFGMVFTAPTKIGEALTEVGARPARALLGRPGPTIAAAEAANANAPAAPAPEAAPAAEPGPAVTAKDWNETILGQQPPTVAQAGDAKVMGPGITEDVFMGSHQQAPEAAMTAQDQARTEASLIGPHPAPPDVGAVARRVEPDLFNQYDALSAQRDDLRAHLAQLASPADEDVAAAQAQVDDLQQQLDAHLASRGGYAGGPEARALRAQVRDAQSQVDALTARREAFAAGQGADTPEMTTIRQHLMATDIAMRDLAPQVAAAHRRAADMIGAGTIPPEAASDVATAEGVPAPAEGNQPEPQAAPAVAAEIPGAGNQPGAAEPTPAGPIAASTQEQAAAIAADVARQLVAAGRAPAEASAAGQLIGSHYVARAARFGGARGTAADLYREEGPVIRGAGGAARAVEPKAIAKPPAVAPEAARAAADATGTTKLVEQLVGRGATDREISNVVSGKLTPEQVAAIRPTISEAKPPLMPTVAQPEIGRPPEVQQAAQVQPQAEPVTVDQPAAPATASEIEALDPASIGVDAKRFQFKAGGDEAGVTERLQGVEKWDPRLAGTALVFRDEAGKDWIADGHQRLALAKRLSENGQHGIKLNAFVLKAEDGISDAEARSIAAIKNISEGTGSAIDAAKVLRESKDSGMDLPPLPPRSTLVRDGKALADLSPDAFGIVVNEVVPPAQGAIVGRLVKDPAEQVEALRLLTKVKPENARQAEMIVRDMLGSGTEQMTRQDSLFGEEAFAGSVVLERAKIADEALKQLRKDKATFGTLVKETERIEGLGGNVLDQTANESRLTADEKASDLLTQLAFRAGPVSDALSDIARRFKAGDLSAAAAGRDFLGALRGAIESGVDTGADVGGAVAGATGERQELATEPGAEGLPQTLIPGVEPITDAQRAQLEADRGLTGGEAAPGGLFDEDAQNQQTLFQTAPAPDTPEFKRWFGNSKVVDEEGQPLVVYHGTRAAGTIDAFSTETGSFFTPSSDIAAEYAGKGSVYRVYLRIEHPLVVNDPAKFPRTADDIAWEKANGYDGAMLRNGSQYVAFEPTQIKSIANRGTFDPNDPRILYQPAYHGSPHISDATGNASSVQALMHGSGLDTPEKLADFSKRVSASAETGSLLSGKSDVAVMDQMRRAAAEQGEVLNAVVGSIPVDVVNRLFGSEGAAKVAFHDEAMLKDGSAFDAQLPVSGLSDRGRAVRFLVGEVARAAAERAPLSSVPIPSALELAGAVGADQRGDLNQGKRASITFRDGQKPLIKLFSDANASSFIHETGHQWLEELMRDAAHPAASDPLKADAQTVRNWLGMEGDTIATRQHEKFARGFEQYMREGVAPSAGLARVFAQFKTWLTSIYQSIKGLGTPISDDIRGVFDRLVAEEPNRTVLAPERDVQPGLAALHEQDAAAAHPAEAEPIGDRIAVERDAYIAQQPQEVQNELAAAESERAAAAAVEPGAETGAGDAGPGPVVADSGQPEPHSAGGGGGGERGPIVNGGAPGVAEGTGVAAGRAGTIPTEPADAGLREQRPGAAGGARAQPLAPDPAHLFGPETSPFVDKAGNIRLDNLTSNDDVAQAIRDSADANNDFIGDRRGVITDGQVLDLADALGMDANQLSARKIGQAFNAEQVMAARKLLIESATSVSELMKKAATGSDEEVMAYAEAKARHQMIQGQVAGITAEAGRALRAFRDISGQGAAQGVDQFLRTATGKTLFQLREEAKLGAKLDTPGKVSKFVNDAQKRTFGQMVLEYWINGLISGPATHTTYMIGNTILSMVKAGPETAAAALIGAARRAAGREGEIVRMGEVGAQFRGAVSALPMATKAAIDSLRTGVTTRLPGEDAKALPFQPKGDLAPSAPLDESITYGNFAPAMFSTVRGIRDGIIATGALVKAGGVQGAPLVGARYSPLGAIPDIAVRGVTVLPVGTMARLPSRFVGAIHSFFRATNYSMAKSALAYRSAVEDGLQGDALAARVGDLRQNPSPEMMEQARSTATQLTLMGQGSEFVQALGKLTNAKILGFPLLKFVDPFVHIAGNIIDQSLMQRTPLGMLAPEIRADLSGKNGNVAQDTAMARMLVGTGLSVAFGSLAAEGLISGSGPADPNQAAMWRLAGNQAHSVRIGDTWYNFSRLGPMGMLAGIAADMYDVAHVASEGDMLKAAAELQHAFTQNILDESFMAGPAELIQALEDPGRYGQSYIRNFLSSFLPYSVAMGQMARATDPYSRQARSVMDAIKAKIPGQSETLMPRRDIWGRPLPNLGALGGRALSAIYMQQVGHDPVNQAMVDLGIGPAMPSRRIRGVLLNDQQYDQYAALAGSMAKTRLDTIVRSPDWQRWPPEARHNIITETIAQSRETARGMVMARNPSIVVQATQAKLAKLR